MITGHPKEKKALVNGQEKTVYKSSKGDYIDCADMTTRYDAKDVRIIQ